MVRLPELVCDRGGSRRGACGSEHNGEQMAIASKFFFINNLSFH